MEALLKQDGEMFVRCFVIVPIVRFFIHLNEFIKLLTFTDVSSRDCKINRNLKLKFTTS